MKSLDSNARQRADREAKEGLLDPFAFAAALFGPVPLPPGFRPARCLARADDMIFTSGRAVSAEYDAWAADYEKNGSQIGKPSFLMGHDNMAKKVMGSFVAQVEDFYVKHGFRRIEDPMRIGRRIYVPANLPDGALTVHLEIRHDAFMEGLLCKPYDPIPSGPVIRLRIQEIGSGRAAQRMLEQRRIR